MYIATEDAKIAQECLGFGADVIITPPCDNGTERVAKAAKIIGVTYNDYIFNVQGDQVLTTDEAVLYLKALDESLHGHEISTLVYNTNKEVDHNTVKVALDNRQCALYFSRHNIPHGGISRFAHLGIYGYRYGTLQSILKDEGSRHGLESLESLEQLKWLANGRRIHCKVVDKPKYPSIDTKDDYKAFKNAYLGR